MCMRGARDPFSGKIHPTPPMVALGVLILAAWVAMAAGSLTVLSELGELLGPGIV